MSIESVIRYVSTIEARTALDSMDDYARMADINPHGPRGVLEQFIEQVERVEVSCRWLPDAAEAPNESDNPVMKVSHN